LSCDYGRSRDEDNGVVLLNLLCGYESSVKMVLEKSSFDIRLFNLVGGCPLLESFDRFELRFFLLIAAD